MEVSELSLRKVLLSIKDIGIRLSQCKIGMKSMLRLSKIFITKDKGILVTVPMKLRSSQPFMEIWL